MIEIKNFNKIAKKPLDGLRGEKTHQKKVIKKTNQPEIDPIWNCVRELILKGNYKTAFIKLDNFVKTNNGTSEDIVEEILSVFIFCIKMGICKESFIFYKNNEYIKEVFISTEKEKILMEKIIDRTIQEHDLEIFLDVHNIIKKEPSVDDKIHFFDQCIINYSNLSVTEILNIIEHMLRSKIIDEHKKTEFIKEIKEKATEQKQYDIVGTIDDMISKIVSLSLFEGD